MKALSLAFKDLQILLGDRGNLFMLFLLPLLFIVVFSGALSGIGKGDQDTRIPLTVVDLDGGKSAKALLQDLDEAGGVRVELLDHARAMERLNLAEIPRVLTIPENMSQDVAARRRTTLHLLVHPNADLEQTDAVRRVVEGAARNMSLEIQLINALEQMREMQAGVRETSDAFTVDRMQKQARSQFERSQREPLVSIQQRAPGQPSEQEKPLGTGDVAVPSMAVLFVFLTAQQTARSIYDEKRIGTFRRLLASPISKAALLAGKMLPNLIVGLIQSAVIFTFGIVGLRLMGLPSVSLGIEPLTTVIVVVLMALCSTAFGVLIAAIARTENQISGLSSLLLWGMGILGGAFIPLFIMEQVLGPLPKVVPHYWANHALTNLMVRGLGLASVAVDMAALLGFTALFFVVGLWRFDFD
jgi:linearmycin/streptolysin S transport system permease protein